MLAEHLPVSLRCTHLRGHGGAKYAVREVRDHLQGNRFVLRTDVQSFYASIDHLLLTPPAYARPDRVDELVKRSQPRPADPFDLPPPSGGSAPSLPAGTDPGAVTNNSASATPGG